ncbi:uncharacterized protein LOC110441830 [Mizuhopecten yessoensis]|uniref:Uncharacterized protein n=1 Tax=Mizuhopecten yessoensis TaxID=6573 RepID=A0A210R0T3_MIZYE|nr:uncharacterized protein LOC110441830 [Mizuhopecten yessoensis]OWF54633.1 hypothetical protein KP79_PYT04360 [Mizuhopecten yessoensis]
MSFCVSYGRLTTNNIKHIYSTKEFKPSVRRFQGIYNPPTHSRHFSETYHAASLRKRLYEDDGEYGYIPRAPAFRQVSEDEVNSVVARLSQPNPIKLHPRACKQYQRGFAKYKHEEEDPPEECLKTPRDVKEMVARLNAPTVCKKSHYYQTTNSAEYDDDFEDLPPVSD